MLTALLGDGKDLIPLKRLIIERTEGTPFFMEEMVQVLFEEGALVRNGAVKLRQVDERGEGSRRRCRRSSPSRIDRLPADEKELLQTLAVIGREFALSLVRRVVDARTDDELERMLADLQMAEFIYEQPATGDIEYIFKHALTQEVAYNSLLIERRKHLARARRTRRWRRCSPGSWTIIWTNWRIITAAATTSTRRSSIWGGRASRQCSARLCRCDQ